MKALLKGDGGRLGKGDILNLNVFFYLVKLWNSHKT